MLNPVPEWGRSGGLRGGASGAHGRGACDPGESCGVRDSVGDGDPSGRDRGGGRGAASSRGAEPACAGEGAGGGGPRPDPAWMTSSPSCDPWCSCCRW